MRQRSGVDALCADISRRHNQRAVVTAERHAGARTWSGTCAVANTNACTISDAVTHAGTGADAISNSLSNAAAVTSACSCACEKHGEADR